MPNNNPPEMSYIATEITYQGADHRVFVVGTHVRVEDFLFVAGMSLPSMEKRLSVPFSSKNELQGFINKTKKKDSSIEFIEAE